MTRGYIKKPVHDLDVFHDIKSTVSSLNILSPDTLEFSYPDLLVIQEYLKNPECPPLISYLLRKCGFYLYNGTLFWAEDGEPDRTL